MSATGTLTDLDLSLAEFDEPEIPCQTVMRVCGRRGEWLMFAESHACGHETVLCTLCMRRNKTHSDAFAAAGDRRGYWCRGCGEFISAADLRYVRL